jgi:flavin reductase (DIM6/NTAB) family NADH-FMN oxidoreductase RutF
MSQDDCPPDSFRKAMGQFATGVAVVTAFDAEGAPHGITVNSLTSVSLSPPLLLYGLGQGGVNYRVFASAEYFALSILRRDQEAASNLFAAPDPGWPAAVPWHSPAEGLPVMTDAALTILCRRERSLEVADHTMIFGRAFEVLGEGSADPLLYHGGGYRGIGQ